MATSPPAPARTLRLWQQRDLVAFLLAVCQSHWASTFRDSLGLLAMTHVERLLFTLLIFVKWTNYSWYNKDISSYSPGNSLLVLHCRLKSAYGQVLTSVVSSGETLWKMGCLVRRGMPISFFSSEPQISFNKDLGKKPIFIKAHKVLDQAKGTD